MLMVRKRAFNKKHLALGMVIVFLAGWLSFSYYLYTNQILVVSIQGTIVDFHATTLALYNGKVDRNVKAVILYLNTPGGLAYSCLEIASYVKDLAEVKPVIAVMGAQCASGGYYIASFATYIYTRENTITGGIGVIAVWVDMSQYYKKQGINITVWSTGSEKDIGADWRPPTKKEYDMINASVYSIFQTLIIDIQRNRHLTPDNLDLVKTGATFSGRDAKELGLADGIGNIVNAEEKAAEMAGLWRFITVTQDMNDLQIFLKAMF